jgi:hypothetical protein
MPSHPISVVALILSAVIHVIPLSGTLGRAHLMRLYGLSIDDPALLVLMRHRSILIGLIAALSLWAVFMPELQVAALVVALVSAGSYVALWLSGDRAGGRAGARVAYVDIALVAVLAVALTARLSSPW